MQVITKFFCASNAIRKFHVNLYTRPIPMVHTECQRNEKKFLFRETHLIPLEKYINLRFGKNTPLSSPWKDECRVFHKFTFDILTFDGSLFQWILIFLIELNFITANTIRFRFNCCCFPLDCFNIFT